MAESTASAATTPRPLQMGAKGAYIVRLLMVGDSACGKTSLVLRFDQNVFSTKFVTTIGVDYRDKMVKVCVVCIRMYVYPIGWKIPQRSKLVSFCWRFFLSAVIIINIVLNRLKVPRCVYNFGTRRDKSVFAV
jgi:hypothetical protein